MGVSQMKRAIRQERWKQCIVECRNSGVPVKAWCRKQGISYSTYYRHEQAMLKCAQDPSDIPIFRAGTTNITGVHSLRSPRCVRQLSRPIVFAETREGSYRVIVQYLLSMENPEIYRQPDTLPLVGEE